MHSQRWHRSPWTYTPPSCHPTLHTEGLCTQMHPPRRALCMGEGWDTYGRGRCYAHSCTMQTNPFLRSPAHPESRPRMAAKHVGASTTQFINFSLLPTLAVQTASVLSAEQKSTSNIPAEVLSVLHLSLTFLKGRLHLCFLGAFEFEGMGESPV